ncbi:MAG: hypothetical protein NWQ06_07580, partial [Leeuwenhoekiella sp.]|nr:hypothetical protein [Leeuwenhoekiella sp.]
MLYSISHTTKYDYDAPVSYCHNIAVLKYFCSRCCFIQI